MAVVTEALEALRLALARRIAGTILPDVIGLLADVLLLVAEVVVDDLPTSDFLLIAILFTLSISI